MSNDAESNNVLQFRPLSETLQDPFRTASLVQIALTVGLVVAIALVWVQVLHPVGERISAATKDVME